MKERIKAAARAALKDAKKGAIVGAIVGGILGAIFAATAGPAVGLIAAVAGSVVASTFTSAIIGAIVGAIVTAAISFVGNMLFGPKQPKAPKPEDRGRIIAAVQSDGPHQHIAGQARVAGFVTFRHAKSKAGSNKNEFFYQVQTIAASEIESIEEWWIANEQVTVDDDGWVTTAPYGKYETHEAKLEFSTNPVDGDTLSLDGQTYTYRTASPGSQEILIGADVQETAENTHTLLTTPGQPGRIDDLALTYIPAVTGTEVVPENAGIVAKWDGASDLGSSFPLAESSAGLSWSRADLRGNFIGKLRVFSGLGADDQVADAYLRSEIPDEWPETNRGRGRAYIGYRAEYDEQIFATRLPTVSVVVKGRKVYDPRTNQNPDDKSTWAWSDNAALLLADYLRAPWGYGAASDEIDEDLLTAAANVCDESVATLTGTEKRYRCWGVIDTSQDRRATRGALQAAMAGRVAFSGGKWRIFAGAYEEPSESLSERNFHGPIRWTPKRSRNDLINTVRGTFISPDHKWQPIAYPTRQDRDALASDNNMTRAAIDALADNAMGGASGAGDDLDEVPGVQPLVEVLDQPFITSHTQAQRVAWIALRGNRQQGVFEGSADLSGLKIRASDGVSLTFSRYGLEARAMICTEWSLSMREDGHPVIGVKLQQDASSVYDTSASDLKALTALTSATLPDGNQKTPAAPSSGSIAA